MKYRYKVEFIANGETQIVTEVTPEAIQLVTKLLKVLNEADNEV